MIPSEMLNNIIHILMVSYFVPVKFPAVGRCL